MNSIMVCRSEGYDESIERMLHEICHVCRRLQCHVARRRTFSVNTSEFKGRISIPPTSGPKIWLLH